MTYTITFGWWIVPALITAASFAWAFWPDNSTGFGAAVAGLIQSLIALVLSLAAWLIWSLLT